MRAATASRPEFGANFDRDGLFSSGSHAHAGYSPWPGGLGEVLPGARPASASCIFRRIDHITEPALRLGSAVSAVARQRGGLARSSSAPRLA
jgi:hypothetical protein